MPPFRMVLCVALDRRQRRLRRVLGTLGLWGFAVSLFAAEPAKPAAPVPNSNAACLECHSDPQLAMKQDGRKLALFVDEKIAAQSAHRSLDCTDCHEKFDGDST